MFLQVTVGKDATPFAINATDANDDTIIYSVVSAPDGLQVDTDGVLTWTGVEYSTNDSVVISVSDGKVNSTFSPQVAICNCHNGGMYFIFFKFYFNKKTILDKNGN